MTFQEWLEDFATPETKKIGEAIVRREMEEIKQRVPADYSESVYKRFLSDYQKVLEGVRDLYF